MRSVSLPSVETDLNFSVTLSALTEQVFPLHVIMPLPSLVLVATPVESVDVMLTSVPAQIGIRLALHGPLIGQMPLGSMIFPVMSWATLMLLAAL